jgi:hypothetical protein
MFDAQGVVYLSLKLSVRADLAARPKSIRFHDVKIGCDKITAISHTQDF